MEGYSGSIFSPSRHTIDNERFDFEVNIYHGTFIDNESNRKGIVSHAHYKSNSNSEKLIIWTITIIPMKIVMKQNPVHDDIHVPESKYNVVTCILFNVTDHKAITSNVFFNQFINNESFKHKDLAQYPLKIKTHDKWSLEDLLPQRRSFFTYEDSNKKIRI